MSSTPARIDAFARMAKKRKAETMDLDMELETLEGDYRVMQKDLEGCHRREVMDLDSRQGYNTLYGRTEKAIVEGVEAKAKVVTLEREIEAVRKENEALKKKTKEELNGKKLITKITQKEKQRALAMEAVQRKRVGELEKMVEASALYSKQMTEANSKCWNEFETWKKTTQDAAEALAGSCPSSVAPKPPAKALLATLNVNPHVRE